MTATDSGGNAERKASILALTFSKSVSRRPITRRSSSEPPNRSILENATNGLTAAITVWDYDLQASNFVLTATSLSNGLAGVSITATNPVNSSNVSYTLTFAPVPNANGAVPIQLIATEGPLSTTNTFTLTITAPTNHAPSFTLATNFVAVPECYLSVTNNNILCGWLEEQQGLDFHQHHGNQFGEQCPIHGVAGGGH